LEAINKYIEHVISINHLRFQFFGEPRSSIDLETGVVILDVPLPSLANLPNVKEKKFLKTKHQIKTIYLSERELNKLYDDVIY